MQETKAICDSCGCKFERIDTESLCKDCEKIKQEFDVKNDVCFICGKKIKNFCGQYYVLWGRRCRTCNKE